MSFFEDHEPGNSARSSIHQIIYYFFLFFIFLFFTTSRGIATKSFYLVSSAFVVYSIIYLREFSKFINNKTYSYSVLIISYLVIISVVKGQIQYDDVKACFRLIIFLSIMVLFFSDMRRLQALLNVIVAATMVGSFVDVYDYFMSGNYRYSLPFGVERKFLNQIYAGGIYSLVAITSVHQFLIYRNHAAKTLYASCFVYLSALIFLTKSRAALLCFIISILIYFVIDSKRCRKYGFVALLFLVVLAGLFNEYVYDLSTLIERKDSHRLQIWINSYDLLKDNILFGHGLGSDYLLKLDSSSFTHPHNLYLYAIFTGGLICFVLLSVLLWVAFKSILRNNDKVHGPFLLSILFYIITFNFFDSRMVIDDIGVGWQVFWLPIGIIAAFSSLSETVSVEV